MENGNWIIHFDNSCDGPIICDTFEEVVKFFVDDLDEWCIEDTDDFLKAVGNMFTDIYVYRISNLISGDDLTNNERIMSKMKDRAKQMIEDNAREEEKESERRRALYIRLKEEFENEASAG